MENKYIKKNIYTVLSISNHNIHVTINSMMHQMGTVFYGDLVLDSFNMVYTTVMKTAFKTKNVYSESFWIFIMKI